MREIKQNKITETILKHWQTPASLPPFILTCIFFYEHAQCVCLWLNKRLFNIVFFSPQIHKTKENKGPTTPTRIEFHKWTIASYGPVNHHSDRYWAPFLCIHLNWTIFRMDGINFSTIFASNMFCWAFLGLAKTKSDKQKWKIKKKSEVKHLSLKWVKKKRLKNAFKTDSKMP